MYTLWIRLNREGERTSEQEDRAEDITHNAVQKDKREGKCKRKVERPGQ